MTSGSAASACRACAAPLAPGAVKCERCGALQRDDIVCPHCGGRADASPHAELRFACDVCGAPRVPSRGGGVLDGREILAPLRAAEHARRARSMWRALRLLSGVSVPFLLALTLFAGLVLHAVTFALVLTFLAILPAIATSVIAGRRSAARTREIGPAIDAAWLAAATEVLRQSGGALQAPALAAALRTTDAHAEELLTLVSVDDFVRSGAPPRARIEVPAGGTQILSPSDAARAAEAALEADAEAMRVEAEARHAKRLS